MIKIKNLYKNYGSVKVIDNFNLKIKNNEVIGLVGPNGVGKSTIIGCICGITRYDSGDIYIDGQLLDKNIFLSKRKVGVCFQDTIYDRFFSIYDSIRLYCMYHGYSRKESKKLAMKALEATGLTSYKNYMGDKLSGGMRKRFQIAISTVHNPDLLILDEPTAGIDLKIKNDLIKFLNNYIKSSPKKTIIIVSHNLEEIKKICSRVVFMKNGKICEDLKIKENIDINYLSNLYTELYMEVA